MHTIPLTAQRVWRNHYFCDDCQHEFCDEMLTQGPSWCPCCDAEIEPQSSEALMDLVEADEEDA